MHSHNIWMMTSIYPWRVRTAFPETRLICSPRGALSQYSLSIGSRLKPLFWVALQRRALMAVDCLHATAESEAEDLVSLGLRRPIAIIPNGVDVPEAVHRPQQNTHVAMYLGRIHPEKGLEALLEAWAQLAPQRPQWRLRLVGPDPVGYRATLERRAAALGLDSVDFLPPVIGQAKWDALSEAEFVVLPSPSENFGIVVAEALGCGVPVVATTGTPWGELPKRGAGWYCGVASGDLAAAMLQATALPLQERRRMGEQGRDWVRAAFGWKGIADRFLATYDWVRAGGAPPSWVDVSHVR